MEEVKVGVISVQDMKQEVILKKKRKKMKRGQEEEEDPYTFAEIDDSEYDTILASRSIKKKKLEALIHYEQTHSLPHTTHKYPSEEAHLT